MPKSVFTDAYASFLEVLIAARKSAGVSQVELGARLGKTQTFVSVYERGVRRLDIIEFYAIAKALGVPPEHLFANVVRQLPERVEI
jgi:transcriptional regulator with XRE-family HTH domain